MIEELINQTKHSKEKKKNTNDNDQGMLLLQDKYIDRRVLAQRLSPSNSSSNIVVNVSNTVHRPIGFRKAVLKAFNIRSMVKKVCADSKPKAMHIPKSIRITTTANSTKAICINSISLLKIKNQLDKKPLGLNYGEVSLSIFNPRNTRTKKKTHPSSLVNTAKAYVSSIDHLSTINNPIDKLKPSRSPMTFPIKVNENENNNNDSLARFKQIMSIAINNNSSKAEIKQHIPILQFIDNVLLPSHCNPSALSVPDDPFPISMLNAKIEEFIANDYENQKVILMKDSISVNSNNLYTLIGFPIYLKEAIPIDGIKVSDNDSSNKEGSSSPFIPLSFENIEAIQPDVFNAEELKYILNIDYASSSMKKVIDLLLKALNELIESGLVSQSDCKQLLDEYNEDERGIAFHFAGLKSDLNNEDVVNDKHYKAMRDLTLLFFNRVDMIYGYITSLYRGMVSKQEEYDNKFRNEIEEFKLKNSAINENIEEIKESIGKLRGEINKEEIRLRNVKEGIDFKQKQLELIREVFNDYNTTTVELKKMLENNNEEKKKQQDNRASFNNKKEKKGNDKIKSPRYSNESLKAILVQCRKENKGLASQLNKLQSTTCSPIDNNKQYASSPIIITRNNKANSNKQSNDLYLILGIAVFVQVLLLLYLIH